MSVIKTAARIFEVYELFNVQQRPLPLKTFVEALGYPPSSGSALMKSLVSLGYMEYDLKERVYFPTTRMNTMVEWIEKKWFDKGTVLSAMHRLHEVSSETISLAVQSDLHAQYVHQIATTLPLPYPRIRQTIRPLAESGLGWLMLSAWDEAMVRYLARRLNHAKRDSAQRIDIDALVEKIKAIQRAGYVFSKHTIVQGAGMIGMLIPPASDPGERRFALCVQGPVERLEAKRDIILRELASVTHAIGALGGIR